MFLDDMSNWSKPEFPVGVAAKVAGMSPAALRKWFAPGRSPLSSADEQFGLWRNEDEEPAENGLPRLLTFRTVLHIALTYKLVSKGVSVSDAYMAAAGWVHVGDAAGTWGDEKPVLRRLPGGLFGGQNIYTAFIHRHGDRAEVVPVSSSGGFLQFRLIDLMDRGADGISHPTTIIILDDLLRRAKAICGGFYSGTGDPFPPVAGDSN